MRPLQRKLDSAKDYLIVLVCVGGSIWGVYSFVSWANENQAAHRLRIKAQIERVEQRKVQKCEAWGKLQGLKATYRAGLGGKCLGRHKNGSLFLIGTDNGSLTKLKGRD